MLTHLSIYFKVLLAPHFSRTLIFKTSKRVLSGCTEYHPTAEQERGRGETERGGRGPEEGRVHRPDESDIDFAAGPGAPVGRARRAGDGRGGPPGRGRGGGRFRACGLGPMTS